MVDFIDRHRGVRGWADLRGGDEAPRLDLLPANGKDDAGNPAYGSFTPANRWPSGEVEAKTVHLDRFSGKSISRMDIYSNGGVSIVADTLVIEHAHGHRRSALSKRIVLTLVCLAVLWSVISSAVMHLKRRRPGTAGRPRHPRDLRMANGLIALMVVIRLVYSLSGATALVLLGLDHFVVRKVPWLSATVGQR